MKNKESTGSNSLSRSIFLRFIGSSPNKKTCFCKQAFLYEGYVNYR
ncbi:hypothetical protein D931_04008 [Enterococcus faecium 13.SD.W.09]|nr:hypothetical protein D931_04008 [Enterococcus faecium 13.SD.W.09]